jgi:DNA-binding NarL/FixJ family response regulator
MSLLITGLRNKAIALQLGISAKTVDVHRNRIMKKTQARSFAELVRIGCARAAAAARAVNRGLLSNMHDSSAASNDDAAGVRPAE